MARPRLYVIVTTIIHTPTGLSRLTLQHYTGTTVCTPTDARQVSTITDLKTLTSKTTIANINIQTAIVILTGLQVCKIKSY